MRFLRSIKFRLTVWYLVAIAVLLFVFGGVAYLMLERNLHDHLDNSLKTRATELIATLAIRYGRAVFAEQPNELLLVYLPNGALLQGFGPYTEVAQSADMESFINQVLAGESAYLTVGGGEEQQVRLYAAPLNIDPFTRIVLVAGRSTAEIDQVLRSFRYILGISGMTVIALAGAGGWLLARRTLKPVDRMTRTAQDIGATDLSRRINVHGEDELGRLASTLNQMIQRLEAAFNRQRQFTTDASHELRTPLAVMQAESTLALSKERTQAEYRKSLELIAQEVAYMSAIVGKLLFLARSEAGKEPLNIENVDIGKLLAELAPDVDSLAREKGLNFSLTPEENLIVRGDRVKLRQLFLNIMENAVRYTPGGGSVSGRAAQVDNTVVVSIADTGIGIPPEHLPHLFERFYRVDKARSRAEGGAGLGLAIARHILELHSGKIEVESEVGKGSVFRIVLPLGSPDSIPPGSGS